jgi:hypothetical protein
MKEQEFYYFQHIKDKYLNCKFCMEIYILNYKIKIIFICLFIFLNIFFFFFLPVQSSFPSKYPGKQLQSGKGYLFKPRQRVQLEGLIEQVLH